MLNDKLLEAFMSGFYGFGNYHAPYWFIGMEEGGKAEEKDIANQLEIWAKWGQKELLDVIKYAHEIGFTQWYGDKPILQQTWRNLIRVVLIADGKPSDNETIRQYQKTKWGTEDGETCVVELLPLPSRDTNSWLYKEISALPYLASRESYRERIVSLRIAHLQNHIIRYQPKAVVCYGSGYDSYWKTVANIGAWEKSPEGVNFSVSNSTLFVATKHPTRSTNEHFHNIGKLIARFKSTELYPKAAANNSFNPTPR